MAPTGSGPSSPKDRDDPTLTVIPANAKRSGVFAFDTGPGNMLIDALVSRFTHNHSRFDKGAHIAVRGKLVPQLLDQLMQDPYLERKPPN